MFELFSSEIDVIFSAHCKDTRDPPYFGQPKLYVKLLDKMLIPMQ
jgi:hypothetical protein